MTINTCIVGYGLSAKIFHLPYLLSDPAFTLHSIVQRSPPPSPTTKGQSAPADFPHIHHYRSFDDALANPAIDLLIITSIPSTHFDFTRRALESHKHVLCEKPFVPTAAEASALAALAHSSSRILAVYQNRRYDADFLTLRHLLATDALGPLAELESHFDRHRPAPSPSAPSWKSDPAAPAAGALYDLGTHLLDQLVALFGAPDSVTATLASQRPDASGPPDSFTLWLRWRTRPGFLATVKAGVVSPLPAQLRFLAKGARAAWRKEGLDVQEAQLHAGLRPAGFDARVGAGYFDGPGASGKFGRGGDGGVLLEVDGEMAGRAVAPVVQTAGELYRRLGVAIAEGGATPVSAEEAAAVLRVVEAAIVSSAEGRTVEL